MIYDYVVKQDGQTYEPGENVPEMGSLVCTSFVGNVRHYKGVSDDRVNLPTYVGEGSTFTASDTGAKYTYSADKGLWYRTDNNDLTQIEKLKNLYGLSDDNIQKVVKYNLTDITKYRSAEIAKKYFPVGTTCDSKWTNTATGDVYDYPWEVIHYGEVEDENGNKRTGMFLQSKYIHPISLDPSYDVVYTFTKDMPAGEYYLVLRKSDGTPDGDYYVLTFSQPIPGNSYLIFSSIELAFKLVAKDAKTILIESISTEWVQEHRGKYLGDYIDYDDSPSHRYYKMFCWHNSIINQYLNSDAPNGGWWSDNNSDIVMIGGWEEEQTGQRFANQVDGFLRGLPAELSNIIGAVKVESMTYSPILDRWFDSSYYAKAFIPSITEIYGNPTGLAGESSGEPFDYWKNKSGATEPLAVNDGTGHEDMISYITYKGNPDDPITEAEQKAMPQALRTGGASSNDGAYIGEDGSICTGQIVDTFRPIVCVLF